MDFIGTEVGIKIRSAIKAKLTEIGKTVDDELIDYIMVMVANKKEESQMSKDLQPFLESDTVKFTSWLHKVLQKLEQVTVIVTDDEYKIATSAFGKVGKKRKTSESSNKKKANSKEEPKEKKKKVKHDKHGKTVAGGVAVASNTQTLVGVNKPSKTKSVQPTSTKTTKVKKNKIVEVVPVVNAVSSTKKSEDVVTSAPVSTVTEPTAPIADTPAPTPAAPVQKKVETSPTKYPVVPRIAAPVVQRPVMMVSDDDDDDDDFINIKTDMAEEELLLEDEKRASVPTVLSAPVQSEEDVKEIAHVMSKPRTVVLETIKVEVQSMPKVTQMVQEQPQVSEATVREALVAPSTTVTSTTSSLMPTRKLLLRSPTQPKSMLASAVRAAVSSTTSRPPIMSRIGAVLKRKADPDSDDEGGAKNGSVASVIKVKPRPKLPASAQAPKSLLLRAMADAQRSIATAPARVLSEPETKRPPLFTKRFRDQQGPEMMERFAITLPNVQASEAQAEEEENMEDQSDTLQLMEEPDEAYVPELVAAAPSSLPVDVIYSPSPIVRTTSTSNEAKEMPRANTPEFLVTLDGYRGYDYTMNYIEGDSGHMEEEMENYESQMPEEEEEEAMEETEKYQDQEEQEQDSQKPRRQKIVFNSERLSTEDTETDSSKKMLLKSLDRCRFWPACRQGDACTFHHPTQPCKSFPNCSFGDRCLYIHPNCKFDAVCTRKDCPFTHASPRNLATIVAAPIAVLGRPVSQRIGGGLTCRFYPNCSNTNCRFFHPKSIGIPCRYGRLCSKPDCSFTHSEIPPKEKMKWVSTVR